MIEQNFMSLDRQTAPFLNLRDIRPARALAASKTARRKAWRLCRQRRRKIRHRTQAALL
jgi:hypothetical protein